MFLNIARVFPLLTYFGAVIYSMVTQDTFWILLAIYTFIFANIFNHVLKKISESLFPTFKPFARPNPPKGGCGYFDVVDYSGWGMPSGHAQTSWFFSTGVIMYLGDKLKNGEISQWQYNLGVGIMIILAAWVSWSRIMIGCHNILQVIVGTVIGILSAYFLYPYIKLSRYYL